MTMLYHGGDTSLINRIRFNMVIPGRHVFQTKPWEEKHSMIQSCAYGFMTAKSHAPLVDAFQAESKRAAVSVRTFSPTSSERTQLLVPQGGVDGRIEIEGNWKV